MECSWMSPGALAPCQHRSAESTFLTQARPDPEQSRVERAPAAAGAIPGRAAPLGARLPWGNVRQLCCERERRETPVRTG